MWERARHPGERLFQIGVVLMCYLNAVHTLRPLTLFVMNLTIVYLMCVCVCVQKFSCELVYARCMITLAHVQSYNKCAY